tara:strand:+ start:18442 stop:18618 length:177 start_codon:yes stop_codon:yes gene_type:complete
MELLHFETPRSILTTIGKQPDTAFGELIAHCLSKEPSERPESIDLVAERLLRIGGDSN